MIILVVLAVTKPTRPDYISWAKDKVVETAKPGKDAALVAGLVSLLGNTVIDMTTLYSNTFHLFSLKVSLNIYV